MSQEDMITIRWETTSIHSVTLPRAEVAARLGHSVQELGHRPIIDELMYPGEPGMDGSRHELAEALGELEDGDGEVRNRMITWVDPDA
jgi:hypothetical protein